ncbi:MAG TPA: dTDP-4-dehydrorhamnose 3,5-epimerase [Bacteroidia bacterium]|jgi:dTDP-4-dehydrorhamnose 3,5-epimerase|nr:dTDP-4-dehydrorhamnose 3,5-epimerase [Bacteroidia bacterium]
MEILKTPLEGLFLIKPKVFEDGRGYFYESWNREVFMKAGISTDFIQDNQSLSQKNVLRGLHFQNPPHAQAKLVRVINGAVNDVALDLRKNSPTYGKHFSVELTATNMLQLFIPEGFAHGFETLEDNTIFSYKCSSLYHKASEDCILWNDPHLAISWKTEHPVLSEKDRQGKAFQGFNSLF